MASPGRKRGAPRRERAGPPAAGASRAPSQRERLIDAIVELAGQHGYQNLSIAQISAHAGVSSATFYEQFADREECLLAAYRDLTGRTLASDGLAAARANGRGAVRPAFTELLRSVQEDPDAGRVMFVEALAGGPSGAGPPCAGCSTRWSATPKRCSTAPPAGRRDARHPGARADRRRAPRRRAPPAHAQRGPPAAARRGPARVDGLLRGARRAPGDGASVRRRCSGPARGRAPQPAAAPELARLPRGRHGLPPGTVLRNQRARIIQATAAVTMEKGYANATVAEIVAEAGVAKEAFYRHFSDKEEAFLAAQEAPGQQILDTLRARLLLGRGLARARVARAARAARGDRRQPRDVAPAAGRVLRGGRDGRSARGGNDALVHDLPRGGLPRAARRLPRCRRLVPQAIAGRHLRDRPARRRRAAARLELPRRLPQLTYIAIAPFLGPAEAIARVRALSAAEPSAAGEGAPAPALRARA